MSSSNNKYKWRNPSNFFKRCFDKKPNLLLSLLGFFSLLVIFFICYGTNSTSTLPISANYSQKSALSPICRDADGEKFLWYAPHSGFSNQLSELKNSILMASILDRTLILPPILDHHAVALGSCPKFRVLSPNDLRFSVWNHSLQLIRENRYTSMAEIIDLSEVVPSVRVIDFRVFISKWCGLLLDDLCSGDMIASASFSEKLSKCGSLLSGYNGNMDNCFYASNEDCRTTVWTYQKEEEDGSLDSFQPDEQLKKKKKISFVRRRRDVYKALGPGTMADSAQVVAFGSLFTGPYKGSESHIDIHETPNDEKVQSLINKVEYLPFVSGIISAGKKFARETIKSPFLCAQLRLLDGQFKNHWETTFRALKQKLESLRLKGPLPIHVFVMTDLPAGNWSGSYLWDVAQETDAYKLFMLREDDDLVRETTKEIIKARHGLTVGSYVKNFDEVVNHCHLHTLPDILLFIEETVCSCASLGFVGTAGSTIAETIKVMRKRQICTA